MDAPKERRFWAGARVQDAKLVLTCRAGNAKTTITVVSGANAGVKRTFMDPGVRRPFKRSRRRTVGQRAAEAALELELQGDLARVRADIQTWLAAAQQDAKDSRNTRRHKAARRRCQIAVRSYREECRKVISSVVGVLTEDEVLAIFGADWAVVAHREALVAGIMCT